MVHSFTEEPLSAPRPSGDSVPNHVAPQAGNWESLTPDQYAELRSIAEQILRSRRAPGSPQATSLVHSAWITLTRPSTKQTSDPDLTQAMVARAMRSILVDEARRRHALKRAPGNAGVSLDAAAEVAEAHGDALADQQWISLDEALTRLAAMDERKARIVELRFFRGLEVPETAEVLGISRATVKRDWQLAKAWLFNELQRGGSR